MIVYQMCLWNAISSRDQQTKQIYTLDPTFTLVYVMYDGTISNAY